MAVLASWLSPAHIGLRIELKMVAGTAKEGRRGREKRRGGNREARTE